MTTLGYPTLAEIQDKPELPALTMLYNVLGTAREAILRTHPDTRFLHVNDAPTCHEDDEACWAAHMLAIMASELQVEIDNYCWPEREEENESRFPLGFDPEAPL